MIGIGEFCWGALVSGPSVFRPRFLTRGVRLMQCRSGCGACCVALSISSPLPGHPHGKPAGERCLQLDTDNRCRIFGRPERPAVCLAFAADPEFCGSNRQEAMARMHWLETATRTDS